MHSVAAASATLTGRDQRLDLQALMRIRNLELRARVVVEGFWTGLHRSPYHGFSVEFTEYRPYVPGDDARYLDWRLLARTDRCFIKKFEDETNLACHLLVDHSRSMLFGSTGFTKATYANTLAATLAYFLHQQGDAVGVLTFDAAVREYLPARHRIGHLRHLMRALEKPPGGEVTDLSQPLRRAAELVRRRGLLILVSDLLAPVTSLARDLAALTASGHELVLFHLLDPAELSLSFDRPALFHDLESGREFYLDPASVRAEYQRRLEAHSTAVRDTCRELGATCHRLATNQPLELALFDFLRERLHTARKVKRIRRPTG